MRGRKKASSKPSCATISGLRSRNAAAVPNRHDITALVIEWQDDLGKIGPAVFGRVRPSAIAQEKVMTAIIAWYETVVGAIPLSLLEVWGRFAYIVGFFLAVCAFGGFTFRHR
jgi:hypothetical protein